MLSISRLAANHWLKWTLICILSGVIAWISNSFFIFVPLFMVAAGLLCRHQQHQQQFAQWVNAPSDYSPPDLPGVWENLVSTIYQQNKEQRQQRSALTQALQTVRQAARALPDGVIMLDEGLHIEWFNDSAKHHFALNLRDVGTAVTQLLRQPELVAYIEENLENPQPPLTLKFNHPIDLSLSIDMVSYGAQRYMLISRDISEHEKLTVMRRDFVANVSHELKTPLTVVSGFLDTLHDHDLPENQAKHFIKLMQEQTQRMQQLINDLLALASIENQVAHNEELLDMQQLITDAITDAKQLSQGQHEFHASLDARGMLKGTRSEIWSILTNLLSNAVRYTPHPGHITITWQITEQQEGVLTVSDTGIGIETQHIPRLTERFYRVDNSRTRVSGGTGLGLAIVKHALSHHQGELIIHSKIEQGSTFSTRFPASRILMKS